MPYSSMKISSFFLELAQEKQEDLTPLKLQKLLYFAHGWHLVLDDKGEPLLDEVIEAWRYGPVVPSIYHKFKDFRDEPINIDAYTRDSFYSIPNLSDDEIAILDPFLRKIWEIYAPHPALHLSNLTHLSGAPWRDLYDKYKSDIPKGKKIKNNDMKRHFQCKLERSKANKNG